MNAHDILQAAAGHMRDRAATYDKPEGERSMGATADALMGIFGFKRVEGGGMKTDRELLELAAKAAGIVGTWHERGQCIHVTDCAGMSDIWWRPLQDDGDAMRLAHALGMHLALDECHDMNDVRTDIVMAAAAIGEGLE